MSIFCFTLWMIAMPLELQLEDQLRHWRGQPPKNKAEVEAAAGVWGFVGLVLFIYAAADLAVRVNFGS